MVDGGGEWNGMRKYDGWLAGWLVQQIKQMVERKSMSVGGKVMMLTTLDILCSPPRVAVTGRRMKGRECVRERTNECNT